MNVMIAVNRSVQDESSLSMATINYTCLFDEEFKYILLPVSYSVVFVVGFIFNAFALWIFSKMRPWNPMMIFMFNLALSDFMYVLSLPTLIYYYANRGHWPFGVAICKIARFLFYTNLYCSILFLTCISVHRYLGICHPIQALNRVRPRHAYIVCAFVWGVVTVCLIPNLVFVTTSVDVRRNITVCHDTTSAENFMEYVDYSSVLMVLLFVVPFGVIVVCYCLMAQKLCRPRQGLSVSQRIKGSRQKSIKLIVVVLVVFAVSFVPFHVTRTLYYTARLLRDLDCRFLNIVNVTYKATRPLASLNSCIDPILYFLAGDHYRSKVMSVLMGRRPRTDTRIPEPPQSQPNSNSDMSLIYRNIDPKAGKKTET